MRRAFIKTLTELAAKDDKIYLLTGDLGFSVFEDFSKKFPKRFINCGVAEQNMMGVAAGLALSGKKPYVYSIVPFVTLRCLEQIRNDVCYQNLDVKIIGVGGGFSYGSLGSTHSVMEDLAILRTLPNMTVIAPADLLETEVLILESYKTKTPAYIRLMNIGQNKIHDTKPKLQIGKPEVLKEGKDALIISCGIQTSFCLKALVDLKNKNLDLKLVSIHTLKPIDEDVLMKEVARFKNIFTFEESSAIGGLGSAIAEILLKHGWRGNFIKSAIPDSFSPEIGSVDYLRKKNSIDQEEIKKTILNKLK